mmetsp:Transcript_20829/g.59040  ORF Transcript_20829/g.59040 Transcript_20829/m.59040 type:complete len:282 (-) Transcript_20829:148-993(-)
MAMDSSECFQRSASCRALVAFSSINASAASIWALCRQPRNSSISRRCASTWSAICSSCCCHRLISSSFFSVACLSTSRSRCSSPSSGMSAIGGASANAARICSKRECTSAWSPARDLGDPPPTAGAPSAGDARPAPPGPKSIEATEGEAAARCADEALSKGDPETVAPAVLEAARAVGVSAGCEAWLGDTWSGWRRFSDILPTRDSICCTRSPQNASSSTCSFKRRSKVPCCWSCCCGGADAMDNGSEGTGLVLPSWRAAAHAFAASSALPASTPTPTCCS